MNIPETYDYLVRARRDLWATLKSVPDEVLSRPLLDGSRFHCIKDIVMHIPDVEDGWTRGDILRDQMAQKDFPTLRTLRVARFTRNSRSSCYWITGGLWSRAPSLTSPP
jgi:uncharacterized damage-inducible protein DinB